MKEYKVFSSIYPTVADMLLSRERDYALELNNVSKLYKVTANSLGQAMYLYQDSEEFEKFWNLHTRNPELYYLDENLDPVKYC